MSEATTLAPSPAPAVPTIPDAIASLRACIDKTEKAVVARKIPFRAVDHTGVRYEMARPIGLVRIDIAPLTPDSPVAASVTFRHVLLPMQEGASVVAILQALEDLKAGREPGVEGRKVFFAKHKYADVYETYDATSGIYLGGFLTEESRDVWVARQGWRVVPPA